MKNSTILGLSRLIAKPEAQVAASPRLVGAPRGRLRAEPWRSAWTASQSR